MNNEQVRQIEKQSQVQNEMVIILDKNKQPLGFCSEKRAKELLANGVATIHRLQPFIIRHKTKDVRECKQLEFKIKIDPGSKETGISIADLDNNVYCKIILVHRGQQVVENIKTRRETRRNRRNRKTRYRKCKYKKGGKFQTNRPEGWLPPSIMSIEQNIINWVKKLCQYVNIVECSVETVRFDMQKLDNPDIKGIEYQHGTLEGTTVKSYLLEKYGHTCQYCNGASGNHKLEVEHMISKTNGGSDRIDNLTIACHTCNQAKDDRNLDQWLNDLKQSDTELNKKRVKCITKFMEGTIAKPKNYGAWVNSYKNRLLTDLEQFNFRKIEQADGVTTQMNRLKYGLSKQHYNDAICVGNIPKEFKDYTTVVHIITAKGRGTRLKGKPNKCGILSKNNIHREKTCRGFMTGDICLIDNPKGKYKGRYIARIAIRHSGSFDFRFAGKRYTVAHKYCTILQRGDSYAYVSEQSK